MAKALRATDGEPERVTALARAAVADLSERPETVEEIGAWLRE